MDNIMLLYINKYIKTITACCGNGYTLIRLWFLIIIYAKKMKPIACCPNTKLFCTSNNIPKIQADFIPTLLGKAIHQ